MIDFSWVPEAIIMTGIAVLGFFIKTTMSDFKNEIKDTKGNVEDLKEDLNNLKADLPLLYVTREDFIRTLNSIDKKLDKIYFSRKGGNDGD